MLAMQKTGRHGLKEWRIDKGNEGRIRQLLFKMCSQRSPFNWFNQVRNIKPKGVQHRSIPERKGLLVKHNEQKNNVESKRNVHFCPLSFRGTILPLPDTTSQNLFYMCSQRSPFNWFNQVKNIKPKGVQHRSIPDRKGPLVKHNEKKWCLQ